MSQDYGSVLDAPGALREYLQVTFVGAPRTYGSPGATGRRRTVIRDARKVFDAGHRTGAPATVECGEGRLPGAVTAPSGVPRGQGQGPGGSPRALPAAEKLSGSKHLRLPDRW
ncbi:hypothetical protein GCM10010512_00450 [Streptomyces thermoviolaceus subsp. thermoviolaceus]|nr:hypothetical protein GCM10010512_00450 [Streptomyces thermoviolaceus subsp. thermoviolaceus]